MTFIMSIVFTMPLISCSQDETDSIIEEKETIQLLKSKTPYKSKAISNYSNIEDTLSVEYITKSHITTHAIQPGNKHDGTAQGTPKKILDRQKVVISNVKGVPTGVYFADIYETSGTITLPDGAKDVDFDLPEICGYIDWTTREEGVIKTTTQTKNGNVTVKKIKWSFYTIALVYNAAGASVWYVLPMDGAKIILPYDFVY